MGYTSYNHCSLAPIIPFDLTTAVTRIDIIYTGSAKVLKGDVSMLQSVFIPSKSLNTVYQNLEFLVFNIAPILFELLSTY